MFDRASWPALAVCGLLLSGLLMLFTDVGRLGDWKVGRLEGHLPISQPSNLPSKRTPEIYSVQVSERSRYGFVAHGSDWTTRYDIELLNAGWAVDSTWGMCLASPGGVDRVFLLPTKLMTIPPGLDAALARYPGHTWLIGNEPDCIWQDALAPADYAQIYHDYYFYIKDRDPSAQVAAGNIVQPTPARLAWLDAVLDAYWGTYSQTMPVDVWAIHNQILNELRVIGEGDAGCDMPPGINDLGLGVTRYIDDNDRMDLFTGQIVDFRQWMADNGYRDLPLLITEFGVLMPADYGFPPERVNAFMSATFDWLASTADAALGDPADGNRLVQRWAWYSLNDRAWDGVAGFNGNLFDPDVAQITVYGQNFAAETAGLPPLTYLDLAPGGQRTVPAPSLPGPTGTLTVPYQMEIRNRGTLPAARFSVTLQFEGPVSGAAQQVIEGLGPGAGQWLSFSFSGLPVGGYSVVAQIDPADRVVEQTECNNEFYGHFIVPLARQTLPLVGRRAARLQASPSFLPTRPRAPVTKMAAMPAGADSRFKEWVLPGAGSYPAQIAVGRTDGTIWFTERDADQIAYFNPSTELLTEYPVPASRPWGLALDAGGDVWFAATVGNEIGRLDPTSGTVTTYTVPTADAEPWEIGIDVADPAGIVWFTERSGNKIGRLDPATGGLSEYDESRLPISQPAGIVVDYQGPSLVKVWFTETAGNRLSMLQWKPASYLIEPVPIPTPASAPQDVTLNVEGIPWFTETAGNRIGDYVISTIPWPMEYSVPTPASAPFGIAVDLNGQAVWFAEQAGSKLGWFSSPSADEVFKEYDLPTPSSLPTGVAVDGAGCAWYTAPGANRIGRFCPTTSHIFLPLALRRYAPVR